MNIKVLDKLIAEQIAAGEVIENPASVVKELVENSIDAGATRIDVEIEEGGKKLITVTDNGCGIIGSDLPLAFQRFATSKLSALEDLDQLSSLGFRGEALPSIAAVARVKLITRPEGSLSASVIEIGGGEVSSQSETGAPTGTRVEVKDLFFNTPGRLKFLRAASVESTRISTLLSEMSLARPDIAFSLKSGKRNLFSSSGDGILLHAIASLYGQDTAEALIELHRKDQSSGINFEGYTSSPYLTRSSRRWITLIVNGRLVKSPMIVNAIERAYGDLLPSRRHPLAVLLLKIPPHLLDVNVHPAKIEIRFQDPETIKSLVYRTARLALQQNQKLPEWPEQSSSPNYDKTLSLEKKSSPTEVQQRDRQMHFNRHVYNRPAESIMQFQGQADQVAEDHSPDNDKDYRLIGQYLQSYLLVEKGEDLLLIDQHAAHERIHYHRLSQSEQGLQKKESVQLTLPQTINTPSAWRNKIPGLLPALNRLGFDLEQLGEDNYVLRAVPFLVRSQAEQSTIYDLLETLVEEEPETENVQNDIILKTIACHRSVKAKQPLSRDEMEQLLEEWIKTPLSGYCPHGRPSVLRFNRNQLEKGFQRKGTAGDE